MRVTVLFVLPALALLATQANAQLAPSPPDNKAIPKAPLFKIAPPPKPVPFKFTPLLPPPPPRVQTNIMVPPSPRTGAAPASNSQPQPAAAKPAPPKPTLSAPEPVIKSVRSETLSGINILMAKAAASTNPSVARALATMKKQQLDWPTPPPSASPDLAVNLAHAMKLDDRAQKLLPQLAAFNNALSGPPALRRQGALTLFKAAGKPVPKDADLTPMLAAALAAHNAASPDTQHGLMNVGTADIAINSSPATALVQATVFQPAADGKPERVTLTGQEVSKPDAAGNRIQTDLEAQPPQVVSSKQSDEMRAKVNGVWTDQDGNIWEVAGAGDAITFTETQKDGHRVGYIGKWKLGLPYASHLVNDMADMDNSLPDDVKQQLADTYHPPFAVQLTFDPDKMTFTGVWISGEVTYSGMFHTVKLVNDPTWDKPLVLTQSLRPFYHVASVKVDYSPWEAAMRQKSSEERVTQLELDDRKRELDAAINLCNVKLAAAKAEQAKLLAARAVSLKADQAAVNAVLDSSSETPQYKQMQANIDRLNRQLAALNAVIDNTKAIGGNIPNATLDRQQGLEDQIAAQTAQLQKLADALGLSKQRAALDKAAEDAADARRREEVNYVAVVASAEAAKKGQEEAIDLYLEAVRRHDDADAQVHALEAKGVPLITYVNLAEGARSYYRAQWWDPKELLDFLDKEIPLLENTMLGAADDRIVTRGQFFAAQQQALDDQGKLYSGIMKSAAAQSTIEAGFYFYDVYEKFKETGPLGALAEAVKKLGEAVVLGFPSFYEPQLAQNTNLIQPVSTTAELWKMAKDTGAKRLVKTAEGAFVSARVKQYLADHSLEQFLAATGKAVTRGPRGTVILDAQGIVNARALWDQFRKAYASEQKAWADATFKVFTQRAVSSFKDKIKDLLTSKPVEKLAVGIAKDLAKQQLKMWAAESLEGAPLYDSIFSEYKAQSSSAIFMAASAAYWESIDELKMRIAERDEVLRDYDPNTQLKASINEKFPAGEMVRIEMTDRDGKIVPTVKRTFKVLLGGHEAHLVAGPYLQFDVLAKDLKDDGNGGVDLSITVSE